MRIDGTCVQPGYHKAIIEFLNRHIPRVSGTEDEAHD